MVIERRWCKKVGELFRDKWSEDQIAHIAVEVEELFVAVRKHTRTDPWAWAVVEHIMNIEFLEELDKRSSANRIG
jgi:hypothetical protein